MAKKAIHLTENELKQMIYEEVKEAFDKSKNHEIIDISEIDIDILKSAYHDLRLTPTITVYGDILSNLPSINEGVGDILPPDTVVKNLIKKYNKELSRYKSILDHRDKGQRTSNRIYRLTEKRNNRMSDFVHKASRMIVNHLVSNDIRTLVVGYNQGWKQDINIGRKNNQSFVQIPFERFLRVLDYKCRLEGIKFLTVDEGYTSKCSFLDGEDVCKHDAYCGSRVKRGLFKSADGTLINADVNGSYNILRKCMPNAFNADGVAGVLVHPVVIKATNAFH